MIYDMMSGEWLNRLDLTWLQHLSIATFRLFSCRRFFCRQLFGSPALTGSPFVGTRTNAGASIWICGPFRSPVKASWWIAFHDFCKKKVKKDSRFRDDSIQKRFKKKALPAKLSFWHSDLLTKHFTRCLMFFSTALGKVWRNSTGSPCDKGMS